ncbi:MAG: ABC transporter ATP-binding protein [Armatimonadota bacterium]
MRPTPDVRLRDIQVRFGATIALYGVSLDIPSGARIALLGENGAGKSTLAAVLAGFRPPDAGTLEVDGTPLRLRSPVDAHKAGIGLVPQHDRLIEAMTVAENLALGCEPRTVGVLLDLQAMRGKVRDLSDRLGFDLDPDARVGDLSLARRQRVAIANALHRGARVLILDEPTAVLAPADRKSLSHQLDRLTAEGVSLLVITHRLTEAFEANQAIHVLRRGKLVATFPLATADPDVVARTVVGNSFVADAKRAFRSNSEEVACAVEWPSPDGTRMVNVRKGTVVGVAGVDGSGAREFLDVLSGISPAPGALHVFGCLAATDTTALRRGRGVDSIGEDRHLDGLAMHLSVWENVLLGSQRSAIAPRLAWIDRTTAKARAARVVDGFSVICAGTDAPAESLSGGNQQKLLLGRALDRNPRLLVVDQPTRGLDPGAAATVHQTFAQFAADGGTLVMGSADLDELRRVSDRILVFHGGLLIDDMPAEEANDARLGLGMTGGSV